MALHSSLILCALVIGLAIGNVFNKGDITVVVVGLCAVMGILLLVDAVKIWRSLD